jgi:eukaryotic-like serine/threonine-protein kinase
MGEVFLAEHRHMQSRAAIKVLRAELCSEPAFVQRFLTEARALARLRHPGIVSVLDCDILTGGRAYIVMEYLEGETLRACLARVGSLVNDMRAVVSIAGQVASALSAAHARGIVHRDLKPDNIFLANIFDGGGQRAIKVLDFGIAKLASNGPSYNPTRSGAVMGTPKYMSPEQCRGGVEVDSRSDIYSLGCILFEMLTGRPVFEVEGEGELLVCHVGQPPPDLLALAPSTPADLAALVKSMLEKDPANRPQSMNDIVRVSELYLQIAPSKFWRASPQSDGSTPPALPPVPITWPSRAHGTGMGTTARVWRKDPRFLTFAGLVLSAVLSFAFWPKTVKVPVTVPAAASAPATPSPPPVPGTVSGTVAISVMSRPPGASLWVGRESSPRGTTPAVLTIPRSRMTEQILLKAKGFRDKTVYVSAAADTELDIPLDANPVARPTDPPKRPPPPVAEKPRPVAAKPRGKTKAPPKPAAQKPEAAPTYAPVPD